MEVEVLPLLRVRTVSQSPLGVGVPGAGHRVTAQLVELIQEPFIGGAIGHCFLAEFFPYRVRTEPTISANPLENMALPTGFEPVLPP